MVLTHRLLFTGEKMNIGDLVLAGDAFGLVTDTHPVTIATKDFTDVVVDTSTRIEVILDRDSILEIFKERICRSVQ